MNTSERSEPNFDTIESHLSSAFCSSFHAWGRAFSPKRVMEQGGLRFAQANEPGEIGVTGPHRGLPSEYGAGIIRPPEGESYQGLWWIEGNVLGNYTYKLRKEFGIQGEVVYVTMRYKKEGCLLLPGPLMASWPRCGVPIVVTCIHEPELADAFAI